MTRKPHPLQLRRRPLALQQLEDRSVPSSVQGTVFQDANSNGVFDPPAETGLSGWTVYVDNNQNSILDPGEVSGATDLVGNYFIDTTSVPTSNGVHYLKLDLQVGNAGRWMNTGPAGLYSNPTSEPAAVRNFGAHFESYVSIEPVGPETLINSTTVNSQADPSVASDASGNFAVAWLSTDTVGNNAVVVRLFSSDGTPRTDEMTVATGAVRVPKVAMADNGRFAVAWTSHVTVYGHDSSLVRVYDANGLPVTSAITVAAASKQNTNFMTGIGMDSDGDFAVMYQNTKNGLNHKVQRYTAAGTANGKAIDVGTSYLGNGIEGFAMDGSGRFVAVWDDAGSITGGYFHTVNAQRFSTNGQKLGGQMTVAYTVNIVTWHSNVAINNAGRFVVTWSTRAGSEIRAHTYNFDGTSVGDTTSVAVASEQICGCDIDGAGNETFTWADAFGETYFRRLTAGGTLEPKLLANTTTSGEQGNDDNFWPTGVAATGNDSFVCVWAGYGPGDDSGIFAQRFAVPAAPQPFFGGWTPSTLPGVALDWFIFDDAEDTVTDLNHEAIINDLNFINV